MKKTKKYVTPDSNYYLNTPSILAKELFLYPTIIGRFRYEPGYHLKRTHFSSFLIMLIEEGSCHIHACGKKWSAAKGDVVFLDCLAEHKYGSETNWQTLFLHFDGSIARNFYERATQQSGVVFKTENYHSIHSELECIYNDFHHNRAVNESKHAANIYTILTDIVSTRSSSRARNSTNIRNIITYIGENYARPISTEELAGMASLSPYYFSRTFASETGMTPHQYLIEVRISAAKYLLATTPMTVKEIAYQTGYADESSFCASFRKREKVTPSSYRESLSHR